MRKKVIYLSMLILLLFNIAGCSGREEEKKPGNGLENAPGEDKADKNPDWKGEITAEDFQPGNRLMMKTEKGYYYYHLEYDKNDNNYKGAFYYLDSATGRNIYLCNKPECKHDGNIFCVATNEKYVIGQTCLYNGRIFATALEKTDTQYLYKLLAIALDGSEMSEIATYMTINKMTAESSGQTPLIRSTGGNLFIHRNKVVLPLAAIGQEQLEDTSYYGTAILDLNTGKVSYLDEEPLSKENAKTEGVSAYGDYIYYYRKEGRKNVLHQYCVKDGTDESYKLQPGFQGIYAVLDEDNIVYRRSVENVLYLYHPSTRESEEAKSMMRLRKLTSKDGLEFFVEDSIAIKGLVTDGTYLYVECSFYTVTDENHEEIRVAEVYVLNRNFEIIAVVNLAEAIPEEMDNVLDNTKEYNWGFLEDEIYTVFWRNRDGETKTAVYKCRRSDFLEGSPKFEFLYEQFH